jgi:beta-glucosidase
MGNFFKGAWVVLALLFCGQFASAEELPSVERASFPKGFVFGTATAAYQYEGAAMEDGKGVSIWDTYSHQPGKIRGNKTGDVAVDQYHRFAEDIWLMKDMNMDAYRFSISWSRVFPKGVGEVNWEGVKYYDSLIDNLLKLNIEPYVTLYHWDMPQALEDSIGSWLSPQIVEAFTRYARFCFERWGPKVKHWITFNEIHSFAGAGYETGDMPPGRCSDRKLCSAGNSDSEPYLVSHHALLSHAHAVDIYRKEFKVNVQLAIRIVFSNLQKINIAI